MDSLLWLGFISFGLSLILTPIFRDVFHSYGVVDRPDQGRKIHKNPIPRVGGIAIACAYVGSFLLVPSRTELLNHQLSLVWQLLPAAGLIFAVGVVDDLFGLKPWQKLIGQFGAAALAYWAGVRILAVVTFSTQNWWSVPVTILWLIACTNAFNLVDGMDGLASGVGLFATLTIFVAALLHQNVALALATLPLAGCLLGFLCYNFNPATIFLGDSGSLLIGFLLGCYGIIWSQKSATLLGMTAPLIALSIPLLDVSLAIVRRALRRKPIFGADRGHIHHRLLDRGLGPRRAVLILYAICGLAAAFSLLQSVVRNDHVAGLIIVLFCFVAWMGIQYLGYAEFSVASRLLFQSGFQRTLGARLDLQAVENSISHLDTVADCWKTLVEASAKTGFRCVRLQLSGVAYGLAEDARNLNPECWEVRVPLSETEYVDFEREFQCAVPDSIVGPFLDVVRGTLRNRLQHIQAQPPSSRALGRSAPPLAASESLG